MAGNRSKDNARAWGICHRSGRKVPYRELVREPGTGFLVHKSKSDGEWNATVDLLTKDGRKIDFGDPYPLPIVRPDISWVVDLELQDENDSYVLDEHDFRIEVV